MVGYIINKNYSVIMLKYANIQQNILQPIFVISYQLFGYFCIKLCKSYRTNTWLWTEGPTYDGRNRGVYFCLRLFSLTHPVCLMLTKTRVQHQTLPSKRIEYKGIIHRLLTGHVATKIWYPWETWTSHATGRHSKLFMWFQLMMWTKTKKDKYLKLLTEYTKPFYSISYMTIIKSTELSF